MADNLVIFGHTYNGVEGFKATDTNNNEITYTPGGSAPALETLQLSYLPTESLISDTQTPQQGYDGFDEVQVTVSAIPSSYVGSGVTRQAAQTIHPSTSDQSIATNQYLTGAQTIKGVLLTNLLAENIKKDVVVKVGDSTDDDCVTSVTGTYEGSGGSSVKTGTFTPSARTLSVSFDTGLSSINGILIVPTSETPLKSGGRTLVAAIITPNNYYKSIHVCSNNAGASLLTPNASTSSTRMTQSGTSVTVTTNASQGGYFETISYTWYAW